MEKKYKFSDASLEELQSFKEGMDKLLAELSLGISLVINKKEVVTKLENGSTDRFFVDQPSLMIQKKVEKVETEIVKQDEPNQTVA